MGLHDRLKTSNGVGGLATAELLTNGSTQELSGPTVVHDPYAELKTRIHHACIATLGAELFKREGTGDLNERVTRAVTEQLVLDRTPLTRDERRGKIKRTNAAFADNSQLLRIIDKIVSQIGRRVHESSPMVDARLPDGS